MVIDTDILIDHFHGNAAATVFIEEALIAGAKFEEQWRKEQTQALELN
jgi:hypothetical protein